ncbi:fluoride efflux transporter CrcB [Intrasporangium sp. YIM S08009]|uniref:fluoride efflux transporter CrcB n=1 Tax=Intrasporangium zincisolvens TaxID=3080018 RepID=UPI002B055609|nr:fluoride efflux transporter CrcB [Intrasporangium sp. YIM S08009]
MSARPGPNPELEETVEPADRADPVDPDVDLTVPAQRREWGAHRYVLPVIALGGVLGACARYGLAQAAPAQPGSIPWTTLSINVSGSLLIGVLMVFVVEVGGAHPLLRPFLGVGVLGGFTTFSTYTSETTVLLHGGHPAVAVAYLVGTPVAALVGVAAGVLLTRAALAARHRLATRGGSR